MATGRCHPDKGGLYTEALLRQSRNLQLGDPHEHVPRTMHRAPPQRIAPTGHHRGSTTAEMARNAMLRLHGQDATTGGWTMQPHLTTQSSRYTKHGGDVYSTYLPNALQQGYCTETGPTGGFNLVRQPAKGRATGTQHLRAILSLPGDGDDQTTGISTNETLHINVTNAYTYPSSIETM